MPSPSRRAAARPHPLLACLLASPLLGACAEGDARVDSPAPSGEDRGPEVAATDPAAPALVPTPRADDEAARALRRALEEGDLAAARPALAAHAERLGVEGLLLRARAAFLEGDFRAWGNLLESARRRAPDDPRVYATAAELYALSDSFQTAWKEIHAGDAACGPAPELERARGVVWISKQGGALQGLEHLQRAVEADPDLPFASRALGQAHLLVGKQALADGEPDVALVQARAAHARDPGDVETRRFLADAYAALGLFGAAVDELDALHAAGEPLGGELAAMHKRAALAALLNGEREGALEHFRRARERGLGEEELGSGAQILRDEAARRVDAGIAAYEAEDLAGAEAAFRAALELDPERLDARNHLAVVLFRRREWAAAADEWRSVLDTARAEDLELPDPVHLSLARALQRAGDAEGAELVLLEYLDREPAGEWIDPTRELLARVREAAGG